MRFIHMARAKTIKITLEHYFQDFPFLFESAEFHFTNSNVVLIVIMFMNNLQELLHAIIYMGYSHLILLILHRYFFRLRFQNHNQVKRRKILKGQKVCEIHNSSPFLKLK